MPEIFEKRLHQRRVGKAKACLTVLLYHFDRLFSHASWVPLNWTKIPIHHPSYLSLNWKIICHVFRLIYALWLLFACTQLCAVVLTAYRIMYTIITNSIINTRLCHVSHFKSFSCTFLPLPLPLWWTIVNSYYYKQRYVVLLVLWTGTELLNWTQKLVHHASLTALNQWTDGAEASCVILDEQSIEMVQYSQHTAYTGGNIMFMSSLVLNMRLVGTLLESVTAAEPAFLKLSRTDYCRDKTLEVLL